MALPLKGISFEGIILGSLDWPLLFLGLRTATSCSDPGSGSKNREYYSTCRILEEERT